MLLLFEEGSDCIRYVAAHLDENRSSYESTRQVQSAKKKRNLQQVLLLQEQDTPPLAQSQFISDLLAFDLYADLPEITGMISLILRVKTSRHCSKFVICVLNPQG